jgi:4-amino-4-deoxy-L-arabinose transferase-like glycosyltransferase
MVVIGLLGLAVRLAYAIQYTSHPLGRLLWVDEIIYWERARDILWGKLLPEQPFYQDPLVHYLLAVLMKLVSSETAPLRIALVCLGSLTPVATYWAGLRGLGRAEAVVSGFILALYGPLVFTDAQIEKEGPGALFCALALVATAQASGPRSGPVLAALAGLLWGNMTLLRGNALLVAPIGACWWMFCPVTLGARRWRSVLGFLAGFATALAPVSLVNLAVSRPHEFILTTSQGGPMFYTGNGPEASGVGEPSFVRRDPHVEASDFAAEAERRTGRKLTPGQVSSFWMHEGLRQWREAPVASLRFLGFKVGLILNDLEVPDSQSPDWIALTAAPNLKIAFLSFGWLVPWTALCLLRRKQVPFLWFLTAITICGLFSTAVFFVLGRYRVPWAPCLALLAGAGLVDLARRLSLREWSAVSWRIGLVVVPLTALAWRTGVDPDPDRWGYFQLALLVCDLQGGDIDAAIDVLDDARAFDPRSSVSAAVVEPGRVQNQLTGAAALRLISIPQKAESILAQARLARVVPKTHELAGELLDQAEETFDNDPVYWRERGGWWLGTPSNQPAARAHAIEAYRRAVDDASARITLALLTSDPRLLEGLPGWSSERVRLARVLVILRGTSGSQGQSGSSLDLPDQTSNGDR